MDLISIALQVAFYAVFAVALWRYVRRPGTLELALVAVFGAVAAIFAVQLVGQLVPELAPPLQSVAVTMLLAQPVFIVWLVHLIRPLPRWALPATILGFAIATAGLLLPPARTPAALLFVGLFFAASEGAAALALLRIAQGRHGLPRLRLHLAAVATTLFGVAIVASSVGAAAVAPGEPNPGLLVGQLSALGAALTYLTVFLPPRWLQNVGQRAIAFDLGSRLVAAPTGTEPEVLWRTLAVAARSLLGAQSIEIVDGAGNRLARTDELGAPTAPAGEPVPYEPVPDERTPDEQAPDEQVSAAGDRSVTTADTARGPSTTVSVFLVSDGGATVRVLANLEGRLLFVEDDLAVLRLLGTMTMRAVEREDAIIRLAETRRELEASTAVRASEARFRALLEAVPNAVLAVDTGGSVIWATGPTAELFGWPVAELTGVPLAELLPVGDADVSSTPAPASRVRRAEMTARRRDGATFPVDVAATVFELDGRQFHLYVVADATWRQAANEMRDRFLGVLSHELKTPITSIYGGTHLLIGRGERLDEESRKDLLASVAAEAERLLRITENLVVLARVERGADFFEFRPVALRPVLAELVARESTFWPEMGIELQVEPGLPLVAADEDYLSLVLRNLVSNAGKYAGQAARVVVSGHHQGEDVVVRVVDDGPGLLADDAEHIFDLYYRAPDAAPAPGAGIGLFVCRNLVGAMGGRIWATTRAEGGAEFGFTLPIYVEPPEVAPESYRPARAGSAQRR